MALTQRQMEGVMSLFVKAFINASNERERKKTVIDFEDTFGRSISDWKRICREQIEQICSDKKIVDAYDTLVNRNVVSNPGEEYEIRSFVKEDLTAVCELLNASFEMYITPFDEHKFVKYLESGYSFVICAEGSILGVLLAQKIPSLIMDIVYIESFAVAESVRGRGIGKRLFRRLCKQMKADGIWSLRLQTERTREAYEIYKHWGFEEVDMVQMKRYVV